jgi:hypothetical protein
MARKKTHAPIQQSICRWLLSGFLETTCTKMQGETMWNRCPFESRWRRSEESQIQFMNTYDIYMFLVVSPCADARDASLDRIRLSSLPLKEPERVYPRLIGRLIRVWKDVEFAQFIPVPGPAGNLLRAKHVQKAALLWLHKLIAGRGEKMWNICCTYLHVVLQCIAVTNIIGIQSRNLILKLLVK